MKVLFTSAEAVPFVKTGGLGDVMGTLPRALVKKGVECDVILPLFGSIGEEYRSRLSRLTSFCCTLDGQSYNCTVHTLALNGVRFFFVENNDLFGGSVYGGDEALKFSFFCRAVLEALPHIGIPDIIHANDWHTGMILLLLEEQYRHIPAYRNIKTVFMIHNLRYQGLFPIDRIKRLLYLPDSCFTFDKIEYYGNASFMKAGIVYCHKILTVSPTYAGEIQTQYYGEGLDGLLRYRQSSLSGILNGVSYESFDPATDPALPLHYSADEPEGKAACKATLQAQLGLGASNDTPIIGMVSRLTQQKGFSLIEEAFDELMKRSVQLAIIGQGDGHWEWFFHAMQQKYPERIGFRAEYSDSVSRLIYAGSDMFLMPSLFEPCGISQMIAMKYGTLPIVRETGGLKDTVVPYNKFTGEGTGFSFAEATSSDMLNAIDRAIACYNDKNAWQRLMRQAMECDFSWNSSTDKYIELYREL